MSYQLYDQLAGPIIDFVPPSVGLCRTFKYGIKANVEFEFEGNYRVQDVRRGANFTNVLTTIGIGRPRMIADPACYDGWNSKLLDEYGRPMEKACVDVLRMSGRYRIDQSVRYGAEISNLAADNVVGLLYNMLRFWLLKKSDLNQYAVKGNYEYYDDGHVSVNLDDYLGERVPETQSFRFGLMPALVTMTENTVINEDAFIPYLENMTSRDVAILLKCCGLFESNLVHKIAHPSDPLTYVVFQPQGSKFSGIDESVADSFTHEELFSVMSKFVTGNRVQSQFDLAYYMVVTNLFMPMSRSIEAHGWMNPNQEINIPRLSSARGMFKEVLQDTPYLSTPEKVLTWDNFKRYPTRIMVHAAAATEAMYCGFFEIATANEMNVMDNLTELGLNLMNMASPYRMFIESAAYRFGGTYKVAWDTNCGADHLSHLLYSVVSQREINLTTVKDADLQYKIFEAETNTGKVYRLIAPTAKPALFPCLSMAVNDNRYYINETSYSVDLSYVPEINALTTNDSQVANKAMCILRVAGYDAMASSSATGLTYKNWAANSNGQVMPIFAPRKETADAYRIGVATIAQRKHCWVHLPTVTKGLKMSVKINVIDYVAYQNGEGIGRVSSIYRRIDKPIRMLREGEAVTVEVRTQPSRLQYSYSDFRLAAADVTTVAPLLVSQATMLLQPEDMLQEEAGYAPQDEGMDV